MSTTTRRRRSMVDVISIWELSIMGSRDSSLASGNVVAGGGRV